MPSVVCLRNSALQICRSPRISGVHKRRHQPSDFLRLKQTQSLVAELFGETPGIPGVCAVEGSAGGTYVAKELVYAYAMLARKTADAESP